MPRAHLICIHFAYFLHTFRVNDGSVPQTQDSNDSTRRYTSKKVRFLLQKVFTKQ